LTIKYILYIIKYIQLCGGVTLKILISNKSNLPIYEQIKSQIKEQILSGEIKENEYLPSIRQLAKELSISVITTSRAYSDLEAEGYIATMQGKGSIVLSKDNEMVKEQYLKKIEDSFLDGIEYAKIAGIENKDLFLILENLLKEQ
jgi:GntR family transcriptional regulator